MEDIVGKILALFFSLMILGNAYIVKRIIGTWIFPACIFSLFWFAYTFFPLICLFSVPIEPLAIVYIFISTVLFSMSSFVFNWNLAVKINKIKIKAGMWLFKNKFLITLLIICHVFSIILIIFNSIIQGFSLNDIIFNFFSSSSQYTQKRYDDEIQANIFGQLSLIITYMSAVIGGFLTTHYKLIRTKLLIACVAITPSVLIMITQSAKGAFFFAVVIYFAGTLVNKVYNNEKKLFDTASLKMVVISLLIVLPLLTISFLSRGLYEESDTSFVIEKLVHYFVSYAFAHMYAFSDWFSFYIGNTSIQSYDNIDTSYGFYTVMAPFKILGSNQIVPMGVYDEYFKYNEIITTNIYTIFRGLIIDFTLAGSLIYMLLTGFFIHLSFFLMLIQTKPVINTSFFIFVVLYMQNSQVISILMWNNVYASFILLCVLLYLNNFINFKKHYIASRG